ncbi:putative MULE transposase domain, FHY3/FAR1 family [Helianthus annuus]|nr:putative MULE transposase domain, FHY3/FAR1 family [Helianthus annuus]
MQASLKGGEHLVRGTKIDHKNFARDIREFIGERDAQMVIDKLNDDICKCNYNAFGDVVAFDATYDTNKYNMIFVPFTGVDNHQKCVTFGAGLLYNETIESFTWLLDSFLKAHVKQPRLVLTDQDAAMKQAVSSVFTESTHRLCMWHVTKKLPAKVHVVVVGVANDEGYGGRVDEDESGGYNRILNELIVHGRDVLFYFLICLLSINTNSHFLILFV